MLIAKLRISLRDASIQYNRPDELGTATNRGTVLADGKVVRGLGTHFANQAAKERFDRLTKESNDLREQFNRRFLKSPIDGVFIINAKGEARTFVATLTMSEGIDAYVTEFELGGVGAGLDAEEMGQWAAKVKTQLERIPLGRGKDIDGDGIKALKTLAKCPVLAAATATAINTLIAQVECNKMDKVEFKRSIELLSVEMDQSELIVSRGMERIV